MDFFTSQDIARKKSRYLVFLFLLAVFFLVCLANVVIAFCLFMFSSSEPSQTISLSSYFSWDLFGLVCLGVNAVVILAIVFKWIRLSDGGKSVAESLGGKRILPNSPNNQERRILNVVEEMALASGMPVPSVYLLAREKGINAFAAGKTPADAVIGITQGSLDNFNREQLQGVVAHEFSHILNGDMRLNLRLIALLNGILFLGHCGHFLLRTSGFSSRSHRRSGGGKILIIALALAALGFIGTFFGGLIKAAINRQREFLADASAVQFTRNPQGISGALKIIGGFSMGSRLLSGNIEEASHLFISNALGRFAFFTTHPPLEERIRRIDPRWDGKMIVRKKRTTPPPPSSKRREKDTKTAVTAAVLTAVLNSQQEQDKTRDNTGQFHAATLDDKLRDPLTATALLYTILLDEEPAIRKEQLELIEQQGPQGTQALCLEIAKKLEQVDRSSYIMLVEKCMPALKCISQQQYIELRRVLLLLIRADKKIDIFEWCLFQLVQHYLGAEFGDNKPSAPRHKTIHGIAEHYCLVISTMIHHCHLQPETTQQAFNRGANTAGLYKAELVNEVECTMKRFNVAVSTMADGYPLLKARMLKGLVNVVEFDRTVTPMEKELITAIAATMDSPLPRLTLSP